MRLIIFLPRLCRSEKPRGSRGPRICSRTVSLLARSSQTARDAPVRNGRADAQQPVARPAPSQAGSGRAQPRLTLAAEGLLRRLPHPLAQVPPLAAGGQLLGSSGGGGPRRAGVEGLQQPRSAGRRGGRVVRVVMRVVVRVVVSGAAVAHGGGRGAPVEAVSHGVGGGRGASGRVAIPVLPEWGAVRCRPRRPWGLRAVQVRCRCSRGRHVITAVVRVLRGADEVLRRQVEAARVAYGARVHAHVLVQEVAHVHGGEGPGADLTMLPGNGRWRLPGGTKGKGRGGSRSGGWLRPSLRCSAGSSRRFCLRGGPSLWPASSLPLFLPSFLPPPSH